MITSEYFDKLSIEIRYLVLKKKEYGQKFKVLSKNYEVVFQVRQDSMQLLIVINSYLYEVVFGQKRDVFESDF